MKVFRLSSIRSFRKMDQTKNVLEQLNTFSCEPQRKMLLRDMVFHRKYNIISAHRHHKTKSGKTVIKVNLSNCYIYLPVRFNTLPDYFLNEINSNREYKIENCGRWKKTFKLVFSNSSEEIDQTISNYQDLFNSFSYYNPADENV